MNRKLQQAWHFWVAVFLSKSAKTKSEPDIIGTLKDEIEQKKQLQAERNYLYAILQQENRCFFRAHIIPHMPPVLFNISRNAKWVDVFIYVPGECREIAQVYMYPVGTDLVIDELQIEPAYRLNPIHALLIQEIEIEAQALQVRSIVGKFEYKDNEQAKQFEILYREMGFEIAVSGNMRSIEIKKTVYSEQESK
jgi:hypothetical protein